MEKMAIFAEFRALFTQHLAKGNEDGAKSLVESLFAEENFHDPDQNMMVGILVQNYPEDYWDAIDANHRLKPCTGKIDVYWAEWFCAKIIL